MLSVMEAMSVEKNLPMLKTWKLLDILDLEKSDILFVCVCFFGEAEECDILSSENMIFALFKFVPFFQFLLLCYYHKI